MTTLTQGGWGPNARQHYTQETAADEGEEEEEECVCVCDIFSTGSTLQTWHESVQETARDLALVSPVEVMCLTLNSTTTSTLLL